MTNTLTSQIGVYNSYSTNRAENPVVTVSINCVFMVKFTSRLALTLPCSSSDIPPVPTGHSSLHFPPRWPEVLFQTSLSVSMRGAFWRDQSRKLHYPYICLRQPNHLKVTGPPKPFKWQRLAPQHSHFLPWEDHKSSSAVKNLDYPFICPTVWDVKVVPERGFFLISGLFFIML